MFSLSESEKFYLYASDTDMRKGFDALCGIVLEGMERPVEETLTIDTPQGERTLKIGGTIDPDVPFTPTPHTKKCEYCDFRRLCF